MPLYVWAAGTFGKSAEVPVWCNFTFFSRIKATPIRKTTYDGGNVWQMKRNVLFFCGKSLVAVVALEGQEVDGGFVGWAVSKVRYALYACGAVPKSEERWVELELEVTTFSMLANADEH